MAAQDTTPGHAAEAAAQEKIADARRRMARYKALIDADGDPAEVGPWISQAKAERLQAEAELHRAAAKPRTTKHQIEALIARLSDVAATLHDADPAQMADAYDKIGLRLTYHPDTRQRRAGHL